MNESSPFTTDLQVEILSRAFAGIKRSTRQWARWVLSHQDEFIDNLVAGGVLEPIDNCRDHNGKLRAAYWVSEPPEPTPEEIQAKAREMALRVLNNDQFKIDQINVSNHHRPKIKSEPTPFAPEMEDTGYRTIVVEGHYG